MKASKAGIAYKNALYRQLALIGKSLSADRRLEIMNLLAQSPKTVDELAKLSQMSFANTSRHLQVLKNAHLVKSKKEKNFVIYQLASKKVKALFYLLRDVGEEQLPRMKSIKNNFAKQEKVHPLTFKKMEQMIHNPETHIVDLRNTNEFRKGHLPGAINIPVNELEDNIGRFSQKDPLILYCRGHLCGYANEATHYLRQKGFKAYSLNETYIDWCRSKAQKLAKQK